MSDGPPSLDLYPVEKKQAPLIVEKGTTQVVQADTLVQLAKRWSPAGVVAALLIGFYLIGGHDGVGKIAHAFAAASAKEAESRKKLADAAEKLTIKVEALTAEVTALRNETDRVSAQQLVTDDNLSKVCDWVAQFNHGKPNKTWCAADGRAIQFEPPPPTGTRIPIHVTGAEWTPPPKL